MADCKSNYTYENWAHTLKFKPERFCEPDTETKVVEIVKDALARSGRVRSRGGGHSWSHFVVTDDTLVHLDRLNKGLIADVLKRRYTVQAGIRLGNLSTSIVGMKLVTGTGDLLTIKESDADLLDAARVSVGALGIITEVTIECVPMYDLEHTTYF